MLRTFALTLCAALLAFFPGAATAQDDPRFEAVQTASGPFGLLGSRQLLGYGRLTTNDLFGDTEDRWRTGSITTSRLWGHGWNGSLPSNFGEMIELRLQGQIIAPDNLQRFDPTDRPWAGALSVGLHTHFMMGETEMAVGGDMVIIGPQTHLDDFQEAFHKLINVQSPNDAVLNNQIGNKIRPTLVMEAARSYRWTDKAELRPFAEGRAGDETLVRVGADMTFGIMGLGELLVRENVSGQRYRTIKNDDNGFSVVLGADITHVFDSVYLPQERGFQVVQQRERARFGMQWQNEGTGVFYGLTWLGREFEGQQDSQFIGSVKLDIRW